MRCLTSLYCSKSNGKDEKAKRIHEAQEWRRGKVLEYTSQGYTQREIASMLQVANGTVAEDQIFLRQQAKCF